MYIDNFDTAGLYFWYEGAEALADNIEERTKPK